MFNKVNLYTTLLINSAWAIIIIVATKKKSRNKDIKAFLEEFAETISYLRNPQNTKRQSDY